MPPTPDDLVRVERLPGESANTIVIGGGKLPEVRIGPYENPAIAERDAENFRAFFAALLATLRGA